MTDKAKSPPSFDPRCPSFAVGGVILDLAYTYMLDRILADALAREAAADAISEPLDFGESILQHTRDAEEWATPAFSDDE